MRFLSRNGAGDRGRRRTSVRRGLAGALLLLLASVAGAAAQEVPDTLGVENRASLTFVSPGGIEGTGEASVTVTVKLTAGVRIAPPRQASARPGERRVFAHVLENTGTGPDRFRLEAAGPAGWGLALHLDLDGDGVLGAGDTPVTGPLPLERGARAALLLVVDVPADAPDDASETVTVRAASGMDAAVADSVRDELVVHRPLPALTLGKTADRSDVSAGDTLVYTLSFINRGDAVAPGAEIVDPLPVGARLVPGSLRLNGQPLTDAADGDAGTVERGADGRETVRVRAGDLLPSAAGTLVLHAVVAADAAGTLENVAVLSYLLPGAAEPVTLPSPAVRTAVGAPRLTLGKEIAGADSVRVGGEAVWRLRWANASATLSVRDAVLVDTLPAGVAYVSADREPEVDGQVLRWRLGTLSPGATGELTVTTRVDEVPEDGRLVNRAVVRGSNADAVGASAAEVHVRGFEGDELEVRKAAGVLEAGMGDAVPYAVTLHNVGVAPVRGIVLRDSLPAGVRYLPESLVGADSARLAGRELTIWVAGPLAPGAERVVRYAVTVVSPGAAESLVNRVRAQAEGGRIQSAPATAYVRLRRGFAMQQRVVVGKVWVDADGDGRQGPGEGGAGGVEVWSEDGEVVTTDAEGRFSFPNLRAGSHALRLDTLGVPAGTGLARAGDEIVRVRLDGWTLPRAEFRLVPRGTAGDRGQGTGDSRMGVGASAASSSTDAGSASVDANPSAAGRSAGDADRPAGDANLSTASGASSSILLGSTSGAGGATPGAANPVGPNAVSANPLSPNAAPGDTTRAAGDSARTTRVKPLRTAEERAAEEAQAFAAGPVVRIAAPMDGAVVSSNRLYVGLRGEAGAEVRLFVGDRQVGEGRLRPDGMMDFVGIELGQGPRRVRAMMRNSFGVERWDSVAVHRSGEPARLELPADAVTMRAGDRDRTPLRVRVLDRWGVPVAGGATVTVEAAGAAVEGPDADASSVGAQAAVGKDGWATVLLRPGQDVGPGELRVTAGDARGRVPLRVLPTTRPLIVTGAGQVGVGAAPGAHGAVTVRGTVGAETSVSVSYDSRRGDDGEEFFDRGFDPLEEGRYPTFGDASTRRVLSGATGELSARVERGYDWMELGDVRTADFGVDERLGFYQRALTGVSGRVSTGMVTWRGFGSITDQVFTQRQLRADGSSGPYRFGNGIRPGTDRVAVEVRARDNAARVIARQELVRYNDYQIDYVSGDVLLNHPVPMTDGAGNPVFVVATLERRSGGEARFVGGLSLELDAARMMRLGSSTGIDSLNLSILGVRDEAGQEATGVGAAGGDLLGGGVRMRRGGLLLGGQLLRSMRPDSAAYAGRAELGWSILPNDRARVEAEWLNVGSGFAPGTDPRLSAGLQELRAAFLFRPSERTRLRLGHEMQRFEGYDAERATTTLRAEQTVAGREVTAEGGVARDAHGAASASSATGKLTMAMSSDLRVWLEGSQALGVQDGPAAAAARPDQVGLGVSYRVLGNTRVEGVRRWVRTHGDSASSYGLTSLNVRAGGLLGGEMWGGIERAGDGEDARHSAVLGWSERLAVAGGWALTGSYERRFGLSQASLLDPTRALPFAQADRDRWAASAGMEFLPSDSALRFSLRGETHGGAESRGRRIDVSADAPLGRSAALLTRHDWFQDERSSLAGGTDERSRRDRSLLGFAFRPAGSDALNMLAKVEWRRTVNPLGGGVLAGAGDERRLIGATDAVWALRPGTEIAGRYAVRWATLADTAAGVPDLTSFAHFLGGRAEQDVRGPLRLRLDGRMLLDGEGGGSLWNLAPALVGELGQGLEMEAGYRFGGLYDPDFAAQGGKGFYATLHLRFTERLFGTAAEFWRERLLREP